MKIGKYDLRICEDGKDISTLRSHHTLPLPIIHGDYDKRIFSYDEEKNPDSAVIVFNHVIDLFRKVDPDDIIEHYDIQISYHDGTDKLPRYYLAQIQGSPYLVSDHFGQLMIPLGNNILSRKLDEASYLERTMASLLLDSGFPPSKSDVNLMEFDYNEVFTVFYSFGQDLNQWLVEVVSAQTSGHIYYADDADSQSIDIRKLEAFSWHPFDIVYALSKATEEVAESANLVVA